MEEDFCMMSTVIAIKKNNENLKTRLQKSEKKKWQKQDLIYLRLKT